MGKAQKKPKANRRDPYLELIKRFPLRPLRIEDQLDRAVSMINGLLDRCDLHDAERDYLDVLSDLVEKYEQENHPISPASDAAMVRYLMDLRDLSQVELARPTGIAESTVKAVLSGKRQLSRRHIGILANFFEVEPAVFSFAKRSRQAYSKTASF